MLLTGKTQVAIKQETTAGSAQTLLAANVVRHKGNVEWEADIPMVELEGQGASLSSFGSVPSTRAGRLKFSMFYSGTVGAPVAGSNEPECSVPFKACGLALTVSGTNPDQQSSYKPSSTTISLETTGAYSTVAAYCDGKKYMIHGAVGDLTITLEVGSPPLLEFAFTGLYNEPSDAVLLVPTYPAISPPPFLSGATSILGLTTARFKSLKFNLGNVIQFRPNPNGATGFFTAQIVGRKITGSLDPEEVLAASKNWFNEWTAGTLGLIDTGVCPSNGSNYNQFQIKAPNAQYTKVGLADRDGMMTAPVDFVCRRNASAGDDEFEFIQT